ncbi:aldehyde dehydrogenase family protein [Pseudomonas sp. Ap32]|nr:aldehyde dehydrogenase family protein [Pseudomonas sp. Ap32]
MPEILGHNFIAGQRSAAGPQRLQSLDASTGEALPYSFTQATEAEVDQAAKAAAAAFAEFRQLAPARRAEFLDAIAAELDELDDAFVAIVCRETALPAARIQGERGRTSGQMRLFAQCCAAATSSARASTALPERQPLPRVDLRQMRIGVGPVAVFGASNFPLAFSTAGDTAAALAAGCPVVFKAHSGHMATADLVGCAIMRAAERTGMPKGVFNMVFGGGVGEWLVKHPAIQAVGFTGSLKGGDALAAWPLSGRSQSRYSPRCPASTRSSSCRAPWPNVARPLPASWRGLCAWVPGSSAPTLGW